MFSIRKNVQTGRGFQYRVHVKSFKYSDNMYKFLYKQYDNKWSVMLKPIKSGVYIERGIPGELINVKNIDSCTLAHM